MSTDRSHPAPATAPVSSTRVLWAVPLLYILLVTADMLAMTHLGLLLTARRASALAVGALASSFWVCIMLSSTLAPRVIGRAGLARALVGGTLLCVLAFGGLALATGYAAWLAAVAVIGVGVGLVWIAGEVWLAESAPPGRRGFYIGIVETAVGAGTMFGPLLLPVVQWLALDPLLVALAIDLLAGVLAAGALPGQPQGRAAGTAAEAVRADVAVETGWRAVALPLVAVAMIGGVLESGSAALLPSIAMRSGFDLVLAAALATVIGAGGALLPTPFGWLADRYGMRRIMLGSWAALVAAALALSAVGALGLARDSLAIWPVGFFLSGMGAVVYTLVTVELGHRLTGGGLVRALALMVTAYTSGTAMGPALAGALFDAWGLTALGLAQVAVAAGGWAVSARLLARRANAPGSGAGYVRS
jgi:MFS family permease